MSSGKRTRAKARPAKTAKHRSIGVMLAAWIGGLASVGLLLFAGSMVLADFGSFRSCNNSNGLTLAGCGKASLNFGDLILLTLFVLAAALVVSLFTVAWRSLKGTNS